MMHRLKMSSIVPPLIALGGIGAVGAIWLRSVRNRACNSAVPQPVKAVDLARYLGRWYELGRFENRFERNCEAVTAEYTSRSDGLIDIVNACRAGAPNGATRIAKGRAKVLPGSGNAKLKVSFFGPFFLGNYWVLDRAEDYAWSIVGEPSGRFLWILGRDPVPPAQTYEELIERARTFGYDMTRFRRTRQLKQSAALSSAEGAIG